MARDNAGRGRGRSRGRGRGRYHPGRNSKGRGSRNSNTYSQLKFYPHTAGRQQTITYDTVKDYIIQHIQKNYEQGYDIAKTLRDLEKKDYNEATNMPTRKMSVKSNQDEKKLNKKVLIYYTKQKLKNMSRERTYTRII